MRPRLATLKPRIAVLDQRIARPLGEVMLQQKRSEKQTDPFYGSAAWKSLMRTIIAQRGRRCEDPQHDPHHQREGVKLYGDHIVELADGGAPLDPRNILLRCAPCHGRKTAHERKLRHRG